MKKVITTIIYVLLFAAAICGIAILIIYLNNGESNFYVVYGDTKIAHNVESLELRKDEISIFHCRKILGVTPEQEHVIAKDYAVTVQPNRKALPAFTFSVDGEARQKFYDDNIDYGAGFSLSKHDGLFAVYMPIDYTMADYLARIYGTPVTSADVELSEIKLYEKDCFVLNIRFIPDNTVTTISFH